MRLLIATEFGPNSVGGGPSVVRQMLEGWPEADLIWWSCVRQSNSAAAQKVKQHYCAEIPPKLMPQRKFTTLKSAILERIWAPIAGAHLRRTVNRCAPDAVWAIPHNWSILPLERGLEVGRIGVHVTVQDYVDVHEQARKFGPARCGRMACSADRLYIAATTRDATSRPMLNDLESRTGASGEQMLHAGVEEHQLRMLRSRYVEAPLEVRIAHAGTILVPEEFALFVAALQRVRDGLSRPIRLDFYGSHSYCRAPWFDSAWMREWGELSSEALLTELRLSTWGFVTMGLTDRDPRYNRFSFPTKFITYLAAGLPVISLGHPQSALAQMAEQYRVGLVSTEHSLDALCSALQGALAMENPFANHAAEIARCAETEFRAARMRQTLWSCFHRCSNVTQALS